MDEELLKKAKTLRLFDDVFMKQCFKKHKECIELVVRIVLSNEELEFVEFKDQELLPNKNGKATILDFVVKDKQGNCYDVEIESARKRNTGYERRTRYYSSMLDSVYLEKGKDYLNLPNSFVIFFCEKDLIGKGLPLYEIKSMSLQTGDLFNDGRTIVIVNGEKEDDTPLGRLVRDFKLTKSNEMYYDVLRKAREAEMIDYVHTLDRPENEFLIEYLKRFEDAARDEGIKEGIKEGELRVARNLLNNGMSVEEVSRLTSISIADLK